MQSRSSLLWILCIALLASCSSGLNGLNRGSSDTAVDVATGNLGFGFDPGLALTAPIGELAIDGAVLNLGTGLEAAPVVFLAFTTAAAAHDGDGNGRALDREGLLDTNGSMDVYLAAISSSAIDQAAFTQGLASVFRHARCITCHSMNSADSLAFASDQDGHLGGGPPVNDLASTNCAVCHTNVPDWRAPASSFDLRGKSTQQLFDMAMTPPAGMTPIEHFLEDPRVNWALADGLLPNANVADDDHDGLREPEDSDGVPRTVPGGREAWEAKINAWSAAGFPYSSADRAVTDIALVSRIPGGLRLSANGASSQPSIQFVPNDATAPILAGPEVLGWIMLAFASDASDLVMNDTNGVRDIFRTTIAVRANEDALGNPLAGSINLVVDTASTLRVSLQDITSLESDGSSANPVIAGNLGQRIAFESSASNLVSAPLFQDNNGADPDIYLRDVSSEETTLVSQSNLGLHIGGNGGSWAAAINAAGDVVAYESRASDLVSDDSNGLQDIFVGVVQAGTLLGQLRASVTSGAGQGLGGDSRAASVAADLAMLDGVRVAFESDKTNLTPSRPPNSTTNVYLFNSTPLVANTTTLLNQRIDNRGQVLGSRRGGAGSADSSRPSLSPDGMRVMFQTLADNLDVVRAEDRNDASDVVIVELSQLESQGYILPVRVSVTTDGGSGDGASSEPLLGSFAAPSDEFAFGFSVFASDSLNLGNSDNDRHVISFLNESAGPFANFNAVEVNGAAPFMVQFTESSSGRPSSFLWDFGDPTSADNSSTLEEPAHTYELPGTYDVKLTIQTANGPAELERAAFIRAFGPPLADFSATPLTGSVPFDVAFSDASSEDPNSWNWDFGDGGSSTLQNPTHTYTTAGTYSVTLDASGIGGAGSKTELNLISAFDPLGAAFDATPSAGVAPLQVNFTDQSTGNPDSWTWDFGGAGSSDLQNPTHTFNDPGSYVVSLLASGPGGSSTTSSTITVYEAVVAAFDSSNPSTGTASYTVNFRNLSSGDQESWSWNFGDPASSNNSSTLEHPSHTYDTAGQFSVTLTTSGLGGTDSITKTNYITIHEEVIADFNHSARAGMPLVLDFVDRSLGSPTLWSWDFGDSASGAANSSDLPSPTHSFSSPGFYVVTLSVSGPGGSASESKTLGVDLGGGMVDFALAGGSTASGLARMVSFVGSANFAVASWAWSFGDGGSANVQDPTHNYTTPGLYTVSVTATDASGSLSDSETKTAFISISTPNSASFSATPTSGNADLTVSFSNTSSGDADSWSWDFGDGSGSNQEHPAAHTYTQAGAHSVSLSVDGPGGPSSATPRTINVAMLADFTPKNPIPSSPALRGFPGMQVQFMDDSRGAPTSWSWNFGEAAGSSDPTAQNPTHTYSDLTPRFYGVSLTSTRGSSSDSETKANLIQISTARISTAALNGYVGVTNFSMSDTTSIPTATRQWDFGDGFRPVTQVANHTYSVPGPYTVTLTVTDGMGGSSTASVNIFVGQPFSTVYDSIRTSGCQGCHNNLVTNNQLFFATDFDAANFIDMDAMYRILVTNGTTQVATCGSMQRAQPFAPESSVLYLSALPKPNPTGPTNCTNRVMPGADAMLFYNWIKAGADR